MAAICSPSWAEVNELPLEALEAINIVKGEINGGEFLWDAKATDPKTGKPVYGVWKSELERKKPGERPGPPE